MLFFTLQIVIISLTGVMAPGPITAVTVGSGTRSPHAGAHIAVGHGIVEFPLMFLIYYGIGNVLTLDPVRGTLFTLGGFFLLFMGFDMIRSMGRAGEGMTARFETPLVAGIVLSLGNVYFLLWWVTVGASLITKAVTFGVGGVVLFATVHWLCDLGWYYFLSAATYRGGRVLGPRFLKSVYLVSGVFLLFFGAYFLRDAARAFGI